MITAIRGALSSVKYLRSSSFVSAWINSSITIGKSWAYIVESLIRIVSKVLYGYGMNVPYYFIYSTFMFRNYLVAARAIPEKIFRYIGLVVFAFLLYSFNLTYKSSSSSYDTERYYYTGRLIFPVTGNAFGYIPYIFFFLGFFSPPCNLT